jgi:hypothetical protein
MFLTEHLYDTLNNIKDCILDNNGIIWGAYVQNTLLNKYYTDIYNDLDLSCENYWNHEFHNETIDRITSDDYMNVHFYSENDFLALLKFLDLNNVNYKRYKGSYDITIEYFFDILIIIQNDMPPYKNLYKNTLFMSHCLIMYKNIHTNKIHIDFSTNSGTYYDNIPQKDRENVKINVIADIYKKKTMFLYINIEQIFDYIKKGWEIINMPYTILKKGSKVPKFNSYCCSICIEEMFDKNSEVIDDVAIVYYNYIQHPESKYYPIHNSCLMNWIMHNIIDDYGFDINITSFKCPYRFTIDFQNYEYLLNYDYYKLNKIKLLNKIATIEI